MARIRSIHPGLTSDEAYMSMSMTAKAAWTPLWMQCDDHGIFEWKPIVLKALIFPADHVEFNEVLSELERLGCVKRIDIDGKPCGVVRNFAKYQRPKNPSYRFYKDRPMPDTMSDYIGMKRGESPSPTPALPQSYPTTTEIVPQRKEEGGRREDEKKANTPPVAKATRPASRFPEFWAEYPKRDGDNPRAAAEKKYDALVKSGVPEQSLIDGAKQSCADYRRRGSFGTQYVPQAVKWLNDKRWIDAAASAFEEKIADAVVSTKFYAKEGSEQLEAWDAHLRRTIGRSQSRDKNQGWLCDAEWPPGYVAPDRLERPPNMPQMRSMN